MRFDPKRCAHCGGPPRTVHSLYGLTLEGRMSHNENFFFCSDDCLAAEMNKYIPRKFAVGEEGKTIGDDPEYRRLIKESQQAREQCYPGGLLYSNEELAQKRQFDEEEAQFIARFENAWAEERSKAIDNAIRTINDTWRAQQAYERHEQEEELRNEAEFIEMLEQKPIPDHIRFEHTHILGPSGSGKTTLIEHLILTDLAKPDPPAMVILDPKGLMVERISKLAIFNDRLKSRLVIVDPTTEPLPALNMFDPPPKGTENQVISNFAYIFSQARAPLTAKMVPLFTFAVRLMFAIPGANIFTLMDLFDDSPKERKFQHHIARLSDEASRRFFSNDFYSSIYAETRQQIKSRLYEIISRPELTEMFNAPVRKLDMFNCLQQRKIVLVNTGMMKLGPTGSQLLGRFIISSTLNAAYRRSLIPRDQWNPAYLFVDEFQDFADDEKTPELLRLAREYNLGVVLAHQNMHSLELNDALRTTISTNTSIKYCSSPEAIDQAYMARDLRCDTDFLKLFTAPGTFACFARGMNLQHPFLTTVQFGSIDRQPKMSAATHQAVFLEAKRALAPHSDTHQALDGAVTVAAPASVILDKAVVSSNETRKDDPGVVDPTEPAAKWGNG
jgi:energy-coupling factor transporter ATP-binding protein EcfA2